MEQLEDWDFINMYQRRQQACNKPHAVIDLALLPCSVNDIENTWGVVFSRNTRDGRCTDSAVMGFLGRDSFLLTSEHPMPSMMGVYVQCSTLLDKAYYRYVIQGVMQVLDLSLRQLCWVNPLVKKAFTVKDDEAYHARR